MRILYITLSFLLFSSIAIAQPRFSKADQLRNEGKLLESIEAYREIFKKNPTLQKNTYNLACAYALTYQKDSAFYYLTIALKTDNTLWALADTDLYALLDDPRWTRLADQQLMKIQKSNQPIEKPQYARKLLEMIMKDQAMDYYIDQAKSYFMKNGTAPPWYYPVSAYKQQIAMDNFEIMQQLIESEGWPTYSLVGKLAADAPLLAINHHESDEVRKKYLDRIKKACLEEEGSCMEYAKIQDRILVNEEKMQIYGMQFKYNEKRELIPFPIENPAYVDRRRKAIGLEPIKLYLKRKINYDWKIEQK